MGDTILVNPNLVFVGDLPGGVGHYGLSLNEQCGRSGLIPHLDTQFVLALGNHLLGVGVAQLAVDGEVELSYNRPDKYNSFVANVTISFFVYM